MMRASLNENLVQELIYQVTLLFNWESSTRPLLEAVIDGVDKYRLIPGKKKLSKEASAILLLYTKLLDYEL